MATFKQIYNGIDNTTPKAQWIKRMADASKKKEITVKLWLAGVRTPGELEKEAIAKELGVSAEELFPVKTENGIVEGQS